MSDDMPIDEQFDEQFDEPVLDDGPTVAQFTEPARARWALPAPTGVAAVDDALAPLVELDELPTDEHVAHYESAHRRLQDALADLDSA